MQSSQMMPQKIFSDVREYLVTYVKKLTTKQEARLIPFCFRKFYINILHKHVHQKIIADKVTLIFFLTIFYIFPIFLR